MTPFEDVIHQLSLALDIPLQPDKHQSCLIYFKDDDLSVQIDLDTNADRILIGTQLGPVPPGTYREKIFIQALRTNGTTSLPRGILAFSNRTASLVLYQFLPLDRLTGTALQAFLELFCEHALIWKTALQAGDVPEMASDNAARTSGMYGLRP